ncbi:alpha-amylase family glycosyl hydrolase [Asticcacaulis sp. ZE23SCel15]|uniref:alpha-amylase family glycosyl hydrolase n=1 Tax=Asticcacaulis sp. ZE23SCel15 TaxID=3059027 RepID=UPI00265FAB63|nr:alpha-amylase family glycosyl hydrolase [Asticcacaulis sp. ZE23SCel15]WKL56720.1 alpha-amylase family glycosyl hydrolase [Asticcacaulis sp. ZE23SCel15]
MAQVPPQTHALSGLPASAHAQWQTACDALARLYSDHPDYSAAMAELERRVISARLVRPRALIELDTSRQHVPDWYLKPGRPAYCTYIDRFGKTLAGTSQHLDYLKELNIGIFHPLPLLKPRAGNSDGGFAVADYRQTDPRLGGFDDLKQLAADLRDRDMSLVLDMVLNHTAKEHDWAQKQLSGDPAFQDFYIVLKSQSDVDEWEASLQDVFPDTAPGSFTYVPEAGGFVWTTFYPFQWDLNYANPRVFIEMVDVLFYLANAGVEGFRLDSTAYLWKRQGTISRNLPETHDILRAFRALLSIVAPSVFLLAEAIESLEAVLPFFGTPQNPECDLAYNNGVMTALWGALADQKTDILQSVIAKTTTKPAHGQWLNYVRCHDDIIWLALADSVPMARLQGWADFYAGKGAYAKGLSFQAPEGFPASGCGMAASLCGGLDDPQALDRLKLLYGVTYGLDGVPLLYMGDEIGLENFEAFRDDPALRDEIRWLHRPDMDWELAERRRNTDTPQGQIFDFLKTLSQSLNALTLAPGISVMAHACPSVLWFERPSAQGRFVCVANFSDARVAITPPGRVIVGAEGKVLPPYAVHWYIAEA